MVTLSMKHFGQLLIYVLQNINNVLHRLLSCLNPLPCFYCPFNFFFFFGVLKSAPSLPLQYHLSAAICNVRAVCLDDDHSKALFTEKFLSKLFHFFICFLLGLLGFWVGLHFYRFVIRREGTRVV